MHNPYKAVWQILKSILTARKEHFLLEHNTITQSFYCFGWNIPTDGILLTGVVYLMIHIHKYFIITLHIPIQK